MAKPRKYETEEQRREAHRIQAREWARRNRAHNAALSKAWAKAHPEELRVIGARRAARKKGLPATLTIQQWCAILVAYKYQCAYCGKKETKKRSLTQDHVLPLSKGGGTTPENIVPACKSCNSAKGDRPPKMIPPLRLLI